MRALFWLSHLFLVQCAHLLFRKSLRTGNVELKNREFNRVVAKLSWELLLPYPQCGNASLLVTARRQHQSMCASWAHPQSLYTRPQRCLTPSTRELLVGLEPFSGPVLKILSEQTSRSFTSHRFHSHEQGHTGVGHAKKTYVPAVATFRLLLMGPGVRRQNRHSVDTLGMCCSFDTNTHSVGTFQVTRSTTHNLRTFEVYRRSTPNKHHAGKFVKRCLANTGAGSLALGLSAVSSTWSRQQVNTRRWNMTQKK